MSEQPFPLLVGDLGGTNAVFGRASADGEAIIDVARYPTREHPTLDSAIAQYLSESRHPFPRAASFAAAGPVADGAVRLTNLDWLVEPAMLRAAFDLERVLVINDFAGLARSLPLLGPDDYRALDAATPTAGGAIAVIGPGTGLGVATLAPAGDRWLVLPGEGGHVTLPAETDEQAAIIAALRRELGYVDAEHALSGAGLVNLYNAVCAVAGVAPALSAPDAITAAGLGGDDGIAQKTLETFSDLLGAVAGNLALTVGARGGVYIGGGIGAKLAGFFAAAGLRARFEAKGRFRGYLAEIPVRVIIAPHPALLGAAAALIDTGGF